MYMVFIEREKCDAGIRACSYGTKPVQKAERKFSCVHMGNSVPETGTFLCVTYMPKLKCKHNDSANMMHT